MRYINSFLSAVIGAAIATILTTANVQAAGGDLYETDFSSGMIFKFTPGGTRTTFASGLNGPEGMAFDRNGSSLGS